jgi:nucleoside-diphosphate-sugar epimerase
LENEAGVPLNEYRRVNVEGTLNLAEQAAEAGARRFIFISSIGVNGLTSLKPFTEKDIPNPVDPYAKSKYEAEVGLFKLLKRSQMELVVIRPPLVYGPNAPGNFGRLVRWVCKPIPLPLGAVNNKRTLISLDNLIDLIMTCVNHPRAANQVFLAGDGQDLSTTELLVGVARAAGVPSRLVATPSSLLMLGAFLLGKKPMAQRLLCSLQIDIRKSRHLLDWKPPLTVEEGLRRCFDENKKE